MNQKQANRDERYGGMDEDWRIADKPQAPRQRFCVPQGDSRERQQDYAVEDSPEEKLLSVVETPHRRQFVILILDVVGNGLRPRPIAFIHLHVASPLFKRPKD